MSKDKALGKNKSGLGFGRASDLVVKFADILAKEGLSKIPGAVITYDVLCVLKDYSIRYVRDEKQSRLNQFYEALFRAISNEEKDKIIHAEFTIEDHVKLMKFLLEDEEKNKAEIYGQAFKNILLRGGTIGPGYSYFLSLLRELRLFDLRLLAVLTREGNDEAMALPFFKRNFERMCAPEIGAYPARIILKARLERLRDLRLIENKDKLAATDIADLLFLVFDLHSVINFTTDELSSFEFWK